MAQTDPLTNTSGPDLGAVEQGDPQAIADAVLQLYAQLQQEKQKRAEEIARLERRLVAGGL